jgi:hypothetical protein
MDSSLRGALATKQSSLKKDWIASHTLAMTGNFEHVSTFPQGNYLRVGARIILPPNPRAQGMPGARAPAALRVKIENTQVSHHRFAETSRHSLREWF